MFKNKQFFNKISQFGLSSSTKHSLNFANYKNFSSQVYGNIVKQSEDLSICSRELVIPFDSKQFLVYFENNDTLEQVSNKIQSCDNKIQKVSFNIGNKTAPLNQNLIIHSLLDSPFEISINNDQRIKYLPSLNYIFNKKFGCSVNNSNINNNFNFFLYNFAVCPKTQKQDLQNYKNSINELLVNYSRIYEKLLEELNVTYDVIEKRIEKSQKIGSLIMLFLVTAHLVVFYVLIYQMYGWDVVEPVTYIISNVYWIFGLGFYALFKNRVDISFFSSNFFRSLKSSKQKKRFSFNLEEKVFVEKHLEQLKVLRESLNKI